MLSHSYQDRNRIDNAVEYILEVLLNKKDAIPEDKNPKQDHTFHAKYVDFKLVVPQYHSMEPTTLTVLKANRHFPSYVLYNYCFSTEINPPPPKA
jgi:hypothetical protein